jgi:hypothetical protein
MTTNFSHRVVNLDVHKSWTLMKRAPSHPKDTWEMETLGSYDNSQVLLFSMPTF